MFKNEFDSLLPTRAYNRRDFVQTAVGSGFAAAVLPVGAQTIQTDAVGLLAGPVTIPVAGFDLPAYRAAPAGASAPPVVLVISEIFGVHEHIADIARRFAKLGYLAIAPDLFVRQGDAKAVTDMARLISEIVAKVPDAQVMGDLDATVAWARTQGGDASKLAITGFCWGGRITWLYSAHNPAVRAGVAWYGRLAGAPSALQPKHPVDIASLLHAPVLGLYGGADAGIPQASIDQMTSALASGSSEAKRSGFVVYPDVPHAFHADYRPSYRPAAASDGWQRCLAWFRTNGVV